MPQGGLSVQQMNSPKTGVSAVSDKSPQFKVEQKIIYPSGAGGVMPPQVKVASSPGVNAVTSTTMTPTASPASSPIAKTPTLPPNIKVTPVPPPPPPPPKPVVSTVVLLIFF